MAKSLSSRGGSTAFVLVVAVALVGISCAAPGAATTASTTAPAITNLTPRPKLPSGVKPITVLAQPNLACTLISGTEASSFLGGPSTGQSLSDGSCWYRRDSRGPQGSLVELYLQIQPLDSISAYGWSIVHESQSRPGAKRIKVDGRDAIWVPQSSDVPLPSPGRPIYVGMSGYVTVQTDGNLILAGCQGLSARPEAISKGIMRIALDGLAKT